MARTAHHPSLARRRSSPDRLTGEPFHAVVLHDLRYGAGDLAEALRESRRPRPRRIRRTVAVHSFPRHRWDRTVARWAVEEERRARQRLRERTGTVLRLVNAPDGVLDLDAAETVDVPPARHRRGGLWFAQRGVGGDGDEFPAPPESIPVGARTNAPPTPWRTTWPWNSSRASP